MYEALLALYVVLGRLFLCGERMYTESAVEMNCLLMLLLLCLACYAAASSMFNL
jgi:hypothetical protein